MFTINSRQEFLPGEPNGGAMRYKRHGGIFIRKWVALALLFAVIALVTAVGLLVYYYAPARNVVFITRYQTIFIELSSYLS